MYVMTEAPRALYKGKRRFLLCDRFSGSFPALWVKLSFNYFHSGRVKGVHERESTPEKCFINQRARAG